MTRLCRVFSLGGVTEYEVAWRYQKALLEHACAANKRGEKVPDSLLVLEHARVFTLGRGATMANVKILPSATAPSTPKVIRVERGGEVTWHGPGQLVAYPILNLNHHKRDLHWYTTSLEETVIRALSHFGVGAGRNKVNTGVWVGQNKISAIGVTASRWHTMHGVSINVCNSLDDYASIVPCGIAAEETGMSVCRLVDSLHPDPSGGSGRGEGLEGLSDAFRGQFLQSFAQVFGLELVVESQPLSSLDQLIATNPTAAALPAAGGALGVVR